DATIRYRHVEQRAQCFRRDSLSPTRVSGDADPKNDFGFRLRWLIARWHGGTEIEFRLVRVRTMPPSSHAGPSLGRAHEYNSAPFLATLFRRSRTTTSGSSKSMKLSFLTINCAKATAYSENAISYDNRRNIGSSTVPAPFAATSCG